MNAALAEIADNLIAARIDLAASNDSASSPRSLREIQRELERIEGEIRQHQRTASYRADSELDEAAGFISDAILDIDGAIQHWDSEETSW